MESLLRTWTDVQVALSNQAHFDDPLDASYTITNPLNGERHLRPGSDEWNQPTLHHYDPARISVQGLSRIGGIDISFKNDGRGIGDAVVALVILDYPGLTVKHTSLREVTMTNPYIPEYLSMRELDPCLDVYDQAIATLAIQDRPQVIFVDGHGRWHERQAGLATAFGVKRGIPTIGIGKAYHPLRPDLETYSKLDPRPIPAPPWPDSAHFRHSQKLFRTAAKRLLRQRGDLLMIPAYDNGPIVGAAVYTAPPIPGKSGKAENDPLPCYVSPGHLISLETCIALALSCCIRPGSRLPEPIILADRMGRDEVKRLWGVG